MTANNPARGNSIRGLSQVVNQMNRLGVCESDEKLVIALDFGTTFSGIAFCFPNQRDAKAVAIVDWPGAEGESAPKIPTLINYDPKDSRKFAWGASVNRMMDNIVGVKLLLDPSQERPLYLPTGNIKRDIKKLPKPPVEIAADFISVVYEHALKEIAKEVPDNYMSMCQKQFVMSGKIGLATATHPG
jgi:molecular chaperone DnaK (HSP70)